VMDEATAALDEGSQDSLLSMLEDELVASTVISVGHRPGLEEFHGRKITLTRRPAGAQVSSAPIRHSLWRVVRSAGRRSG